MKIKNIVSTLILLLFFPNLISSQTIKAGSDRFKYEFLPRVVLPANYKTYNVNAYSEATDGVPLNTRYIYIREEYISGLRNVSVVSVNSGVMVGGYVKGKEQENNNSVPADLQVSVVFNNIEMIDKKEFINITTNLQTNQQEKYYTYKLFFKFSYSIKVKDVKKNIYILDTLINTPKSALFPCDYRYDAFGNKISFPGYFGKPDLDVDYNKNSGDLYPSSKAVLAQTCMNETKAFLKATYGYYWDNQSVTIYRVKSKSPTFDVCDTVSDLLGNIFDSISFHTKNDKHLNWHTQDIKNKAQKIASTWENMVLNEKYANEFKNAGDRGDFVDKMKRNLILAYLLQDEFEKSLKLYTEVNGDKVLGNDMYSDNMKNLLALIKRERLLYDKHKLAFNFN